MKSIDAAGIDPLRIPIGFWTYGNFNTPYIKGADECLESNRIGYSNIKVWIDYHDSPGNQNGFDSSGRAETAQWRQPENLLRSIAVL